MEQKATPALSALVATSQNVQLHYATQSQTSSGSEISIVSSAERQRRCGQAQVKRELAEHRVNELREAKEQARGDREQAKEQARVDLEQAKEQARVDRVQAKELARVARVSSSRPEQPRPSPDWTPSTGSRADLSSGSQTGSIGRLADVTSDSGLPSRVRRTAASVACLPQGSMPPAPSAAATVVDPYAQLYNDFTLRVQPAEPASDFQGVFSAARSVQPSSSLDELFRASTSLVVMIPPHRGLPPGGTALPPQGGVPRPTTDRALPPQGGVPSPTTYDASGGLLRKVGCQRATCLW